MADKQKIQSIKKSGINSLAEKPKMKRILVQDSSDSEVEQKKQTPANVGTNPRKGQMQKTKEVSIENTSETVVEKRIHAAAETNADNGQITVQSACKLCSSLLPRFEAMERKHTNLLNRLTQEIVSLRNELRDGHKSNISRNVINNKILPERPFSELLEFIEFEKKLTGSASKRDELINEFKTFPRTNAAQFIRNGWKRLLNDELSTLFLWRGGKTKRSLLGLTTTVAFRIAFMQNFAGVEEDFFERITTMWFNSSTDRVNKELHIQSDMTDIN